MKQYCISYLCCASKTFENEKKYSSLLLPENTIFSHLQKFAPVRWVPSRRIILCQLPVLCSGRGASKLNISDCRLKLFPLFLSLYTVEFLALRGESRIKMSPNISPFSFGQWGSKRRGILRTFLPLMPLLQGFSSYYFTLQDKVYPLI